MDNDKISPLAIVLTFVIHWLLFFFATTNFPHHHAHRSPYDIIRVSIPVSTEFHPRQEKAPGLDDLIEPPENLINTTETEMPSERDRYYLQAELSQQVHILQDDVSSLNIPIRQVVIMAIYINESGGVDDVTIEQKGSLTDEQQDLLIDGFKKMIFLPGMRGTKVVKSIYRIQLEVNRKIVIHR